MQPLQICIGPTIRIGQEIWCLLYAGFFGKRQSENMTGFETSMARVKIEGEYKVEIFSKCW